MRKIIAVLIMLTAAFAVSAEAVQYQVKYLNEFNNVQTVKYSVWTEDTEEDVEWYEHWSSKFKYNEIIDEDSDARDLAIVNKLDRQGYKIAKTDDYDYTGYIRVEGKWHKVYCWK